MDDLKSKYLSLIADAADEAAIEERIVHDEASMVDFRFRWPSSWTL